jgi:hypothetical protein
MRPKQITLAVLAAVAFVFSVSGPTRADDNDLGAWSAVEASEMSSLRGGSLPEVTSSNTGNAPNNAPGEPTINPSVAGGNAALQIVSNEIGGSVGDTGSINDLTVSGQMNVNAINTGNNNTMLNQLTVIVDMGN